MTKTDDDPALIASSLLLEPCVAFPVPTTHNLSKLVLKNAQFMLTEWLHSNHTHLWLPYLNLPYYLLVSTVKHVMYTQLFINLMTVFGFTHAPVGTIRHHSS